MKKLFIPFALITILLLAGCRKPATDTIGSATESQVLNDFATVLAVPNYKDLQTNANALNQAIQALSVSQTDANLVAAQTAWRNVRIPWETCEGWLFGPVEDNSYDPNTDTWPLDKNELDSLLASSNALTVNDINALPFSLRGYHAVEYVIFGVGGTRTAAQITPRQMTYIVSLSQSIYNTTTALSNSWDPASGNFSAQVINPGTGTSPYFASRKAAFQGIVAAMADICEEVGTSKMQAPLGFSPPTTSDSTQDESSFSHNSTADFTHNIQGVKNAYFCTYGGATGHSLHQLVAANNLQLDNQITAAINDAISSFSTINPNYEIAIYTQVTQIRAAQAKVAALHDLLENNLTSWVQQYIHD